ncbi:MAG: 50S ribosomal protein L3 N(5)-glutamine methyltransferase [Cellvibrionales bacterium]|nr:50S ribosomal protein L3 N(5)-glutamine methyltransferase [Cellvibrionales bacterium]
MQGNPLRKTVMILQDWLQATAQQIERAGVFLGHGTDNSWDEALHLTLPLLEISFDANPEVLQRQLTAIEQQKLQQAREQRIVCRVPVPYITHQAWFCGLPFYVDRRVLIPRSPLGELIEDGFYPWLQKEPVHILDLCCGSACIGIACALAFPEAAVDVADISVDALAVAAINIAQHRVQQRVQAVASDLFSGLQGQRYDLIVCNPPYVDADDMNSLPDEYRHEPELALASGVDGLDFTRRLLREARNFLTEDGVLIVEVGNSAAALEAAFPSVPFTWLAFERGGDGVFTLTAAELQQHAESFHIMPSITRSE